MSTNKEIYFDLKKSKNKYLTDSVIKYLLIDANNFNNFSDLVINFDKQCINETLLFKYVEEIKNGVPYQYVLGKVDFLDINLLINNSCLIPRQESEQLCLIAKEMIKKIFNQKKVNLLDLCSGSGCLSLYLSKHIKCNIVTGVDISMESVKLANQNKERLDLNVNYVCQDIRLFFEENKILYDVLICNPPYISDINTVDEQVLKFEPHQALFANPGYLFYEIIFQNYQKILNSKYIMFFEISEDLQEDLINLISIYLNDVTYIFKKDIYDKVRFLIILKE